MKNIAIVGCGNMGGGHALAIGDGTGYTDWQIPQIIDPEIEAVTTDISKKLKLAGICDIDPVRQDWAKSEGWHVYPTLDDVLADPNVDIVLVATPNHLHAEIAIKAMRAGKHVLCEKPVTPTSAELEEVLKVSRETGKVFFPRQNRRWDPDYLLMKKVYDERPIGKPLSLENRIGGGGASSGGIAIGSTDSSDYTVSITAGTGGIGGAGGPGGPASPAAGGPAPDRPGPGRGLLLLL